MSRLFVGAVLILLGTACSGTSSTPSAAPPSPTAVPPEESAGQDSLRPCLSPPTASELSDLLGTDAPTPMRPGGGSTGYHARNPRPPRVIRAELNGEGSLEAVLLMRSPGDISGDHLGSSAEEEATDHLWVFQCVDRSWAPIGHETFDATVDNGTLDYVSGPGITELTVLGGLMDRDLLRVVVEQVHGGADPRWTEKRLFLFTLTSGRLHEAFNCALDRVDISGPQREETVTSRQLTFAAGPPVSITVERTRESYQRVEERENEAAHDDEDGISSGRYVWLDGRFAPTGAELCRE